MMPELDAVIGMRRLRLGRCREYRAENIEKISFRFFAGFPLLPVLFQTYFLMCVFWVFFFVGTKDWKIIVSNSCFSPFICLQPLSFLHMRGLSALYVLAL